MDRTPNSSNLTIGALAESTPLIFRKRAAMTYSFPKMDTVKPGRYFSKIMSIDSSLTRKGEPAFDVCYDIVNYIEHAKFLLKLADTEPAHYFTKERIVKDSEREFEFIESLSECYELNDEITPDELIGLTELYRIEYYGGDDCMGTIKGRSGFTEEALVAWIEDRYLHGH